MVCGVWLATDNLFASGSVDGVVILWSTNTLNAMKMFMCAESIPREVGGGGPAAAAAPLTSSLKLSKSNTDIRQIMAIGEVREKRGGGKDMG